MSGLESFFCETSFISVVESYFHALLGRPPWLKKKKQGCEWWSVIWLVNGDFQMLNGSSSTVNWVMITTAQAAGIEKQGTKATWNSHFARNCKIQLLHNGLGWGQRLSHLLTFHSDNPPMNSAPFSTCFPFLFNPYVHYSLSTALFYIRRCKPIGLLAFDPKMPLCYNSSSDLPCFPHRPTWSHPMTSLSMLPLHSTPTETARIWLGAETRVAIKPPNLESFIADNQHFFALCLTGDLRQHDC